MCYITHRQLNCIDHTVLKSDSGKHGVRNTFLEKYPVATNHKVNFMLFHRDSVENWQFYWYDDHFIEEV